MIINSDFFVYTQAEEGFGVSSPGIKGPIKTFPIIAARKLPDRRRSSKGLGFKSAAAHAGPEGFPCDSYH
jgi:hypothetical protein